MYTVFDEQDRITPRVMTLHKWTNMDDAPARECPLSLRHNRLCSAIQCLRKFQPEDLRRRATAQIDRDVPFRELLPLTKAEAASQFQPS